MMDWYDGGMSGGGWVVMTLMMLAFLAVLVFLGLAVLRSGRRDDDRPTRSTEDAERLLDERLARGEISPEEYRTRRDLLRSRG